MTEHVEQEHSQETCEGGYRGSKLDDVRIMTADNPRVYECDFRCVLTAQIKFTEKKLLHDSTYMKYLK